MGLRQHPTFPSVTGVLKAHGFYDDLDAAGAVNQAVGKERGSALHKACGWLFHGQEPPWKNEHPELDCYIAGVRSFLKQHEYIVHEVEAEWINDEERLIAHPDSYGILDDQLTVLEIKTGALPSWVSLQTAGQLIARRWGQDKCKRVVLGLSGDGKYKLHTLTDYRDFSEFRCLLQAWHIAVKYQGVKE